MKKLTVLLAMAAIMAVSCKKYDDIMYEGYVTPVNAKSDTELMTDVGEKLKVTDDRTNGSIKKGQRYYIVCDVFKKNAENGFDIRLTSSDNVLVGTIRKSSDIDMSKLVTDPVQLQSAWVSGGYLNVVAMHEYLPGSKTVHTVSVILDEAYCVDNNVRFKLVHDGGGEAGPECERRSLFQQAYVILSFPLKDIKVSDGDMVQMEYSWYDSNDSSKVKSYIVSTEYKSSSFVQEEAK